MHKNDEHKKVHTHYTQDISMDFIASKESFEFIRLEKREQYKNKTHI